MGRPRKRFRKGDKVIVAMAGVPEERGEVISYPKRWYAGAVWYKVSAETFVGYVHECVLVFDD